MVVGVDIVRTGQCCKEYIEPDRGGIVRNRLRYHLVLHPRADLGRRAARDGPVYNRVTRMDRGRDRLRWL